MNNKKHLLLSWARVSKTLYTATGQDGTTYTIQQEPTPVTCPLTGEVGRWTVYITIPHGPHSSDFVSCQATRTEAMRTADNFEEQNRS